MWITLWSKIVGKLWEISAHVFYPLLGSLPIDLDTRLSGDGGTPVAAGDGPMAQAYARIAEGLIKGGMA